MQGRNSQPTVLLSIFGDTTNIPKLEGLPATDMDKIEITKSGITKLLSEFNADKAPDADKGPDAPPNFRIVRQ